MNYFLQLNQKKECESKLLNKLCAEYELWKVIKINTIEWVKWNSIIKVHKRIKKSK